MTLGTTALRLEYAPACKTKSDLYLEAFAALDACLELHQYAPRAVDTGAYACRAITNGAGFSLHSFGPGDRFVFWNGLSIPTSLAVDINWSTNPYQYPSHWEKYGVTTDMPAVMVADIKAIRTVNGDQLWRWGGDYATNKDTMHYEIVCSLASLQSGIDASTIPGHTKPPVQEDDMPFTEDQLRAIVRSEIDASNKKQQDAIITRTNQLRQWAKLIAETVEPAAAKFLGRSVRSPKQLQTDASKIDA